MLNMNTTPSLLKNTGLTAIILNVSLTGTRSNRSAIGARVAIYAGSRKMIDEVMSGGSFYSQSAFTLHFGLGDVNKIKDIEIQWPSGIKQKTGPVPVDQTIKITEQEK